LRLTLLAKRIFPKFKTRLAIRRAAFFPLDVYDRLRGKRQPLTPPRGLWFVGGGQFNENQFLDAFVQLGSLKPHHRVLEAGCGIGKQAVPLTGYLDNSEGGSYEGFDIVHEGILWCQREISGRFPNFRFQHVNVFNKHYNPDGKVPASEWKFPYADNEFDFCFLISVFTHMLPDSVENYLHEISRVLKPNGQAFVSFFLLNEGTRRSIAQGRASLPIRHECGNYSVLDPEFPETTVGLAEEFVREAYRKAKLEVTNVHYGSWSGAENPKFYQDIIVAVRR
jgi:SAM-dependent methyltransferase